MDRRWRTRPVVVLVGRAARCSRFGACRARLNTDSRGAATPLSLALSAFDILALIALIGIAACRLAVLRGASAAALARSLDGTLAAALATATLASLGILVSRTLELNGGTWATFVTDIGVALRVTHFGHVWALRVPALIVAWLACALLLRWHRAWPAWIVLLAAAVMAITRSDTGHPADHGDFTPAVWIDWLHLLGGATWVGSLFGMSLTVFPGLLRGGDALVPEAARIFQHLSTLCGVALAFVVVCGIYNATTQLGSVHSLWTSAYGVALDVKLGVVLVMIAIGAHNRYFKLPRLLRAADSAGADGLRAVQSCTRAVLAESLLGLAVIGATATLLHQMPPADMAAMPSMHGAAAAPTPAISRIVVFGDGR